MMIIFGGQTGRSSGPNTPKFQELYFCKNIFLEGVTASSVLGWADFLFTLTIEIYKD